MANLNCKRKLFRNPESKVWSRSTICGCLSYVKRSSLSAILPPLEHLYLAGHSVGLSDLVTPVATSDGDDRELGQSYGTPDRGGHLLRALDAEANMSSVVADSNKSLKCRDVRLRHFQR